MSFIATSIAAAAMVSSSGVDALRLSTSTGALQSRSVDVVSSNFVQMQKVENDDTECDSTCGDGMHVHDGYLIFTCGQCKAEFHLEKEGQQFKVKVLGHDGEFHTFPITPSNVTVTQLLNELCLVQSNASAEHGIRAGLVHLSDNHHVLVVKLKEDASVSVAVFDTGVNNQGASGFTAEFATFTEGAANTDNLKALYDMVEKAVKESPKPEAMKDFCPADLSVLNPTQQQEGDNESTVKVV